MSVFGYFDLTAAKRAFGTFHCNADYFKAVWTHHFSDMLFCNRGVREIHIRSLGKDIRCFDFLFDRVGFLLREFGNIARKALSVRWFVPVVIFVHVVTPLNFYSAFTACEKILLQYERKFVPN